MLWILGVVATTLIVVAVVARRRRKKIERVTMTTIAATLVAAILVAVIQGPVLHVKMTWVLVATISAVVTLVVGSILNQVRLRALGLGAAAWALYLTLIPSQAFFVIALIGIALAFSHTQWRVLRVRIITIMASVALATASVVAVSTIKQDWDNGKLHNSLLAQVIENDKQFSTWDSMCASTTVNDNKLICQKVNELQKEVDQNTKDIKTIQGEMTSVTEKVTTLNTTVQSTGDISNAVSAIASALANAGWKAGQVNINNIDLTKEVDVGGHAFASSPILTKTALVTELNATSDEATARRSAWESDPVYQSDKNRLLAGTGWYAIQFLDSSCITGNSYYDDGRSKIDPGTLCHNSGDVYWIYVPESGQIDWTLIVRGACGNGSATAAPTPQSKSSSTETKASGGNTEAQQAAAPTVTTSKPAASNVSATATSGSTQPQPAPSTSSSSSTQCEDGTTPINGLCKSYAHGNPGLDQGATGSGGVNNNDGATDSRGLQTNPAADASSAAASAASANAVKSSAAASAAANAGGTSGGNGSDHGSSTTSTATSTGKAGEDTSGGVWGS